MHQPSWGGPLITPTAHMMTTALEGATWCVNEYDSQGCRRLLLVVVLRAVSGGENYGR